MASVFHKTLLPGCRPIKDAGEEPVRTHVETALEKYFEAFRRNVIGNQQTFESPFGAKKIVYADWTASGRAYQPIEAYLQKEIMPYLANTHTGATITGRLMSLAYEAAKGIIKDHVHANSEDALIFCGSGMTGAVNKLQRILGIKIPERIIDYMKMRSIPGRRGRGNNTYTGKPFSDIFQVDERMKPIVFVTHMEHHSNHISWLETIVTVEIIKRDDFGNVDLKHLRNLLEQFKDNKNKIAAITACSNVTGIQTPYHEIAKLVHEYRGLCFVDFACSAPYTDINMHPKEKDAHLDAIYFSPHKFLGGPGTPGVLIFNKKIYKNLTPHQPGRGTIVYSNPWGEHTYAGDVEQREDGGTPPFLQGIKVAMCIRLKEEMGVENILRREAEMLARIFERFLKIKNVELLEGAVQKRLGVISFIITGAHYNLIVKILNDRFGIQARGGCSCAGPYGHLLLHVDKGRSYKILSQVQSGNQLCKPGWIRISLHPVMTGVELDFIMDAIESTALNFQDWGKDYEYDQLSNEYCFKGMQAKEKQQVREWFNLSGWK